LLQAAAVGALTLPSALMVPDGAWGQVAATLPEVTVTAPRPAPVRRAAPAAAPARAARTARVPAPAPSPPSAPAPAPQIPAFQVVATTPVTGLGFDRDKVPAMVQTLPAEDFSRVYSPNVTQTLHQRVPGVFTSDVEGSEFAYDLHYRGFTASPLQGTPQGLAVYMQGIRVNEAFGDTVNWDLIPTIAIGRADVWTNNPAFGLNALGGAISFQMKDGFTYRGMEFDASGGSYGRVGGSLQYGVRNGEWALYLAAQGLKDDGWRYQSPSRIARFYGDLGWKGTDAEVHLVASAADNFFGVIGPTPVELLNNDYRSIFTWPQTTRNQAQLLALNGRYAVTDHWTVQSNLYVRQFQQAHVDGTEPSSSAAVARRATRCSTRCAWKTTDSPPSRRRISKFSTPTTGRSIAHQVAATPAPPRRGGRSTARGPTRSPPAEPCRPPTTTRSSATTIMSPSAAASTTATSASGPTASLATSSPTCSSDPMPPCRGLGRSSTPPRISASARSISMPRIRITASMAVKRSMSPHGCR